jgi:signal transduction histidine kinase
MKKKLITGVGIITIIFVVTGVFIFSKIRLVTSSEEIRDSQEKVLDKYSDIMIHLRGAQADLYRHEAGYSQDIDALAENILKVEDTLSAIRTSYARLESGSCNSCHAVGPKVAALLARLDEASDHLRKYEQKISIIATTRDIRLAISWENEATEEGNRLLHIVDGAAEATAVMTRHIDKLQLASLERSGYAIFIAIILSALLSLAVILSLMRSMREGLSKLIGGIEKVSSGEYGSKVDIASDDEIGFLANKFNGMTDNLNDVTRQKDALMEELRQLNNDLDARVREAAEELRITHEQMRRTETLSAVGTLASGVAHELATPLGSLLSYVRMIRKSNKGGDGIAAEMGILENELVRCRDILTGMLSFVRAPEKEKIPTDINAMLHEIVQLTTHQTRSRKISVSESPDPSLPLIPAVPGRLKQVFLNLIINAIQAMPGGGQLEVATSFGSEAKKVYVKISDTGCGIPESDINRIFEPFYTNKDEGTGLGLSISYGVVKGHGGDIEVESEEGRGTTFVISLPVSGGGITENAVEEEDGATKSTKVTK